MENSALKVKESFLEYEKPGQPKCINNKYKIISYDNPNDVLFVDKKNLSNISDNFVTHLIVDDDMNESHLVMNIDQDNKLDLMEQNEDILSTDNEVEMQDKRIHWDDNATKLLLSLYRQKEPLIGSFKLRSKRKMWINITKKMKESGYGFTPVQVENRFKTLLRAYKKVQQSDSLSTRARKTCLYKEELNSIFIKDVVKLGNVEIQFEQEESNQSFESEDAIQDNNPSSIDDNSDQLDQSFIKLGWDNKATFLLLKLYKEKKPLVETKHFKSKRLMWESIASEINQHNYLFSGMQVENRFKTLLRGYKKVLTSGEKAKPFLYQDELDALFLEYKDLLPEVIEGSERTYFRKEVSERLGIAIDDDEETNELENDDDDVDMLDAKKEVISNVGTDAALQDIRNILAKSEIKAAERHLEMMKVLKDLNQIQNKRNELFEKYLEIQMRK